MIKSDIIKIFAILIWITCDVAVSQQVLPTSTLTTRETFRFRRSSDNTGVTCVLPPHPKNGLWILQNGLAKEGEEVKLNSILVFECRKGYKLSTKSPYVICDRKWDVKDMPECLKLCPPMSSTGTTIVKCTRTTGEEVGCHEATQDTYMSYTCAPFYEAPQGYKTTSLCLDGDWNSPPPLCQPICGRKVHDDTTPLIYGGKIQTVIEYPWVAVLFRKNGSMYENICGGSVINQKLVLTAAHCVTNMYGDGLSSDLFLVGVGKLFNKYNDSRDEEAQYYEVSQVIIHPVYRGDSKRYQADIALIVIKERFKLNKFVQPVCFNDVNKINLQVGTIGVVAGFGIKEGGQPSDELRVLEIPYKSEATCARELPGDWGDRFNVLDKLCAGLYNQSMGVCRGDSGNGLFFKNPENNRYYVHGVVSVAYSKKGVCNIQQNALYTKVGYHYDFVDRELTKYYVKDCTLPSYPSNGKWTISNLEKNPGDIVPSSTILEISCSDGYKLSSEDSHFACESSFVMPTCERLCPNLNLKLEHTCITKGGAQIHCNDATENVILTFSCPSGYKIPNGTKNTRKCLNGAWESPEVACLRNDNRTEDLEDDNTQKVVCLYDSKAYENGVKPEDIDATLCNYVIFDSVGLSHDGTIRYRRDTDAGYTTVADMKERNRKLKVLLSVYGSGKNETDEYPTMAADAGKRSTFISSATEFMEAYNFDGLNVHWDVPMKEDKYIQLLTDLKSVFEPRKWLLTVTVYFTPIYLGYEPDSLSNIVDWINLESYDFYSEWSKYTGQPSALYPSSVENDFESSFLGVQRSISNWSGRLKDEKISVGVAFYGRYYTLKNPRKHGLHAPITGSTNISDTGTVSFAEICENYKDWTRVWDDEQKNPYKYYKNKWLGYDDEESMKLKGAFVKKFGYFGVTVKSVDKDDVSGKCGKKHALMRSLHQGLGTDIL